MVKLVTIEDSNGLKRHINPNHIVEITPWGKSQCKVNFLQLGQILIPMPIKDTCAALGVTITDKTV